MGGRGGEGNYVSLSGICIFRWHAVRVPRLLGSRSSSAAFQLLKTVEDGVAVLHWQDVRNKHSGEGFQSGCQDYRQIIKDLSEYYFSELWHVTDQTAEVLACEDCLQSVCTLSHFVSTMNYTTILPLQPMAQKEKIKGLIVVTSSQKTLTIYETSFCNVISVMWANITTWAVKWNYFFQYNGSCFFLFFPVNNSSFLRLCTFLSVPDESHPSVWRRIKKSLLTNHDGQPT